MTPMTKRSVTSERIYNRLPEVFRAADAVNDETLKNYLSAVLDQQDQVQKLISRFSFLPEAERNLPADEFVEPGQYVYNVEGQPQTVDPDDPARLHDRPAGKPLGATSDLIDPATADEEWLPFLRQLFPVFGEFKNADDLREALIASSNNYARGSLADLIATAKQFSTGEKTVQVYKGANLDGVGGSATPWDILLVTTPGEYIRYVEPHRNLATNPSFETTSGTVEVWKNFATNPSFETTTDTPFEVRRNYAPNPVSTDSPLTISQDGSTGSVARSTAWFHRGPASTLLTRGTGWTYAIASPHTVLPNSGATIYFGAWVMVPADNPATSVDITTRGTAGFSVATTTLVPGVPKWITRAVTSSEAGQSVQFEVGWEPVRGAQGWKVYVSDIQTSMTPLDPEGGFDGSYSPDSTMTPAWTGTPNASPSVLRSTRIEVRRNLATNPSFEATGGTVEVRRNLAADPCATTSGNVVGQARWLPRWYGTGGGAGVTTLVTGAMDGPEAASGVRVPTYMRKTWTVAGSIGDTGFDHTAASTTGGGASTAGLPVVAGRTYTFSSWVRASRRPDAARMDLRVVWRDAAGERILPAPTRALSAITPGVWQRVSITLTAPANAATVSLATDVEGSTGTWQPGDTLDGTALLIEESSVLGPYFDGSTSPDSDLSPVWTGTANASASVLTGTGVVGAWTTGGQFSLSSQQWAAHGTRSLRIIPRGTGNAYADLGGGLGGMRCGMVAGRTYTILATYRLDAPQTGTIDSLARRVVVYHRTGGTGSYTALPSPAEMSPNVAGVHQIRYTVTLPEGVTEAWPRLFNGATLGNGDVWWDDLVIVENGYAGPYFDGSTSTDPDLTPAWTGTANASASVLTGTVVAGVSLGNPERAARFSSAQWSRIGSRSVRISPRNPASEPWVSYAGVLLNGFVIGKTYTVLGYIRLASPQTGPLSTDPARPARGFWVTGTGDPAVSYLTTAPNEAGVHEVRGTFVAGATTHEIRLMNGAVVGGGDVWWDNFAVVEGVYTGPYFDGSASPDSDLTASWAGTANASASVLTGVGVAGIAGGINRAPVSSAQWAASGSRSLRIIRTSAGDSYVSIAYALTPGKTYTVLMTSRVAEALSTNGNTAVQENGGAYRIAATLVPTGTTLSGAQQWRATFTLPSDWHTTTRVVLRTGGAGGDSVWWDNLAVIEGEYTGRYFDGSNPPGVPSWAESSWEGAPDASTSILSGPSILDDIIRSGAKPAGVRLHHRYYAATWGTLESLRPNWEQWEGFTWETIEKTGM